MIGQGQEHGRPKLSQVPYTGAEAVKKIFEQFSQMTASLNRFSIQLESIQDSAKHIAVEFHALAFQMRASRSLFSNNQQGGGHRGGLASHFSRGTGSEENSKTDAEILASFAMRENAKILIRKQLAARNNVKDPTLNDDEILADYEKMLVRKAKASDKFYKEEKAKREAVDSEGMTQDQRDHIEYLKNKAKWTKSFLENPTIKKAREVESEAKHVEYLKQKIKWTEAFNKRRDVVADKNAKEAARNTENLAKYKTFIEAKSKIYEDFQKARQDENDKKKDEDDIKRKKDHPMPPEVNAYKSAQKVNIYKKEQTESARSLNNYVEYLVAKEIEYRAHQDRLAALRVLNKERHKDPEEKPLEALNERKYKSELDQPESLAEDINKFAESYQKPIRSYYNYLTEKENIYAAHKKNMEKINNSDLTPRQKRQKEKDDAAEKEYEEKTKGLSKEEKAKIEPPEENNWYVKKLEQLKSYYLERLGIEKWFKDAELALIAAGIDNKDNLYKTKKQKKEEARNTAFGKKDSEKNATSSSNSLSQDAQEAIKRGQETLVKEGLISKIEEATEKQETAADSEVDDKPAVTSLKSDIKNLDKIFKNKNVVTIDAETVSPPTAPVNSENHAFEAQIVQLSMIMKDALGNNLVEPLNLFIKAADNLDLNKDLKFQAFNQTYLKAEDEGQVLTQEDAAKLIADKIAEIKKKDPNATINRKGTYEDQLAEANNDPVKNELSKIVGNVQKRKNDLNSADVVNVDTDYIIKQLIDIEKKHFKTSELQTRLTKIALDQARKKEEAENKTGIVDNIKQQEASEEGKTVFTIEVQREAFGIKTEGTEHDASVDTQIQDQIFRTLASKFEEIKSRISLPSERVAGSVKNLAENSGQQILKPMMSAIKAVSSIIEKFYSGKNESIQSLNEKEGNAELKITKGSKVVTDASYVEGVKNLLQTISNEMGINIYKIFDKIKISRGESIKGKDGEYQGRVGTKGEGADLKQSLSLAIPDAAVLGDNLEARAKVVALIMEEAFIHGLSNKIPSLFPEGEDLNQAREELQETYGSLTKQKPEELAGAFDAGKYLSSFEELLGAVLKGIAGHNVSGLKDQNLPEGNYKYALSALNPILSAIKKSLSGPMLAAAVVPLLMASMAGAGTYEDERAAGFVNKKDGVEGSAILDPRARENFFQQGIENRRNDKSKNAVEISIEAARERSAVESAKPSSAVEDIKKIRAEKEKEAERIAALKKKAEDEKLAKFASPPPTAKEAEALEKEKKDKEEKHQAWLASGGFNNPDQASFLPEPAQAPPKTLESVAKEVASAAAPILEKLGRSAQSQPVSVKPAGVNQPQANATSPGTLKGPQTPYYPTTPSNAPVPVFSLPNVPLSPKNVPTQDRPVAKKDQKYIKIPMNIQDPLTSKLIKDADTYQTPKGSMRFETGDAPETGKPHVAGSELDQPGGREAENFARNLIAKAKKIEAKIAVDETGKPKRDAYNRLLGDILLDGISLTETLASEGHLHVADIPGNEKALALMKEAAREKKGLWSKKNVNPNKWRKFSLAQKEAHIKDVEESGDIQTPNNTLNEPPVSPSVEETPKEKTNPMFGRLIALALGAAGVGGATLFRVINRKKKLKQKKSSKLSTEPIKNTTPVVEPAEETPAEETPAEETPAEETPAEETPAEETPAEETPVSKELPEKKDLKTEEENEFEKLARLRKKIFNDIKRRAIEIDLKPSSKLHSVSIPGKPVNPEISSLTDQELNAVIKRIESRFEDAFDRLVKDYQKTEETGKNYISPFNLNNAASKEVELISLYKEREKREDAAAETNTTEEEFKLERPEEPTLIPTSPVSESDKNPEASTKTESEKSFEKRKGILQRNLKALFKHEKFKRPGGTPISPQQVLEMIPADRFSDEMRPVYEEFLKTVQETGKPPEVPLNNEQSPEEIIKESMDVSAQARKNNKTLPYNKNLGFILENDPLASWRTVDNPYGPSDSGGYSNASYTPGQSNLLNETGFNNTPSDPAAESNPTVKRYGAESDGYGYTYLPDTSNKNNPNKGEEWINTVLKDVTTGRNAEGHNLPPGWFNEIAASNLNTGESELESTSTPKKDEVKSEKKMKPLDPATVEKMGEDKRGALEQAQKKIEAYLKTIANPIFQKIARANLILIQNQLTRLNEIRKSTAETATEVKKDPEIEIPISEPAEAKEDTASDEKTSDTAKKTDNKKEEDKKENTDTPATKITAEAKQAIPRWREEVPAGWAEVLAETLNRYNGDAYKDHDSLDVGSILNGLPIAKESKSEEPKTSTNTGVKTYKFEAMNPHGEEIKDTVDAFSEEQAQEKIRTNGYFVTKIQEEKKDKADNASSSYKETTLKIAGALSGGVLGAVGTIGLSPLVGAIGALTTAVLGFTVMKTAIENVRSNKRTREVYDNLDNNPKTTDSSDTSEIAKTKNDIVEKKTEIAKLQSTPTPKELETKLQARKMSGENLSDADIETAVEAQAKAVEDSASAIEKLNQELQGLTEILNELIKNKPASDPEARSERKAEERYRGGIIGGGTIDFPGKGNAVDDTPVWAQKGEGIFSKKDMPMVLAAIGAYKRRGVYHMAAGGIIGGGSATITRPSGGSYSSGDVMGPFKDKLNDFVKNTRFGAFVSNLTEASAKIQNFSQSMSGMVANASPDTFATFTSSIKLLSGAVGIALIPVFLKASQIIQTWARDIMNGTGTVGKLFSMFSSIAQTVLDGKFLTLGVGIALLGAAVLPAIAFFGSLVTGVSLLIQGFTFFRAALLASALMLNRNAAAPSAASVGPGAAAAGTAAAGTAAAGAGAAAPALGKGAQALASGSGAARVAAGGVALSGGVLSGIIGGVTEGMENADIKSMGTGENVVRTGAQVVGSGGGAWAGATGGAWAGAALGSLVGPLGTAVGGAVGGLIGGALGAWGGGKLASGASNAAFGDKRRNEKDANGKPLPANDPKQQLAMAFQSSKAQSSYSSVEEAYKKIQVSALGDDPMTAELKKMNEHGLVDMLKALEQINEGVRNKEKPLAAS